jgi:hypothetical protein
MESLASLEAEINSINKASQPSPELRSFLTSLEELINVAKNEGNPVVFVCSSFAEEVSENPCCPGNREGLGGFVPICMIVRIRKNQRYPHE